MNAHDSSSAPTFVLLLAAGFSTRMGYPKVFAKVAGKPVLERSIDAFLSLRALAAIVICVPSEVLDSPLIDGVRENYRESGLNLHFIAGGNSRPESVSLGIHALQQLIHGCSSSTVLIHDAARCLVSHALIARVQAELQQSPAVVPVVPLTDSVVGIDQGSVSYLDRSSLRLVQTPQGFHFDQLVCRLQEPEFSSPNLRTDEGVLFSDGLRLVEGERTNIKVTYPDDIVLAESILRRDTAES